MPKQKSLSVRCFGSPDMLWTQEQIFMVPDEHILSFTKCHHVICDYERPTVT